MLEKFDNITQKISKLILSKGDKDKIKKMVEEQDEIVKSLSDEEADELLSRNIPSQYKAKIHRLREN